LHVHMHLWMDIHLLQLDTHMGEAHFKSNEGVNSSNS
jgi:hypothetical protein